MLIFNKQLLKTKYILHYIFLIGLSIDILTKQLIIYMGYGDFFKFYFNNTFKHNGIFFAKITDFCNLVLVYNKGISFSMLTNNNPMMKWVLSSIAILIVIFVIQIIQEEKKLINKIVLTFVISGAIGNVIDRLRFGAVVDFLDFHIIQYHWPAFNFADIFISCGIFIFIINKFYEYKKTAKH